MGGRSQGCPKSLNHPHAMIPRRSAVSDKYLDVSTRPEDNRKTLELKPENLGFFSLDQETNPRTIKYDNSRLRYYNETTNTKVKDSKLNDFDGRPRTARDQLTYFDEGLKHVHQWTQDNGPHLTTVGFVTSRGTLSTIMATPYHTGKYSGWTVTAIEWNSRIYLCQERSKVPDGLFWGYRFEDYMLSDTRNGNPTPSDTTELLLWRGYYGVYKADLEGVDGSIIYSAEIDAIEVTNEGASVGEYVELKTARCNTQEELSTQKFPSWILQTALVNISKIVAGKVDKDGNLSIVKNFSHADMKAKTKNFWDYRVCTTFLAKFLEEVKEKMIIVKPISHHDMTKAATTASSSQTLKILTLTKPAFDLRIRYEETLNPPEWFKWIK